MATLTKYPAIGYLNHALGKTITATNSNVSFPASNLGNSLSVSSVWQSNADLTAIDIDCDLGSSLDIDVLALIGFNGSDSATCQPKTSEVSNFASAEFNPGSDDCYDLTFTDLLPNPGELIRGRHLVIPTLTTYNSRYTRLTLNDPSNTLPYLQAAAMWAGPLFQPGNGLDYQSEQTVEFAGTPGLERAMRPWKFTIKGLSDADSFRIKNLIEGKLRSGRMLLIPHPLDPSTFLHEVIYCTFAGVRRSMMPNFPSTWEIEMSFIEVED